MHVYTGFWVVVLLNEEQNIGEAISLCFGTDMV
jgi:hypothetical protein